MRIAQASQGVLHVIAYLEAVTQVNNVLILRDEKTVSWAGRLPGIVKGSYYPLEYQHSLDNQQYSLLLSNGSFFQFYYDFDENDELVKARLAFYPRPISTSDLTDDLFDAAETALVQDDEQLYEHLYNWTELLEIHNVSPSNTSHIRFDFDQKTKAHAPSHIQFSGVQEFRISADFFPLPLTFVQLCLPMISDLKVPVPAQSELSFEKNNVLPLKRPVELITMRFGE